MDKPEKIFPQLLAAFHKEALIGIIIRQGHDLEQSWQENEALRQEREALLKRIEELKRSGKRPVAPFRIEGSKGKQEKKQVGSPKGHPGYYRQVSGRIDEQIELPLPCCSTCQGKVKVASALEGMLLESF